MLLLIEEDSKLAISNINEVSENAQRCKFLMVFKTRVGSSVIQGKLNMEQLLLHIKRSQF